MGLRRIGRPIHSLRNGDTSAHERRRHNTAIVFNTSRHLKILESRQEFAIYDSAYGANGPTALSLDQIWDLVDDLIAAHGNWLPAY
jgi:hypothetical protein